MKLKANDGVCQEGVLILIVEEQPDILGTRQTLVVLEEGELLALVSSVDMQTISLVAL